MDHDGPAPFEQLGNPEFIEVGKVKVYRDSVITQIAIFNLLYQSSHTDICFGTKHDLHPSVVEFFALL
jgi:hypothetical protein